jgi:hypothetical protein
MKLKSLFLISAMFVLSAVSMAQTPFSNNYFDATFNGGAVASTTEPNDAHTSTNYDYESDATDFAQVVTVRLIDHDIAVDLSSSNFYADADSKRGEVISRSTGSWQGHPFTYTCTKIVGTNGVAYTVRARYIIVGPREAYFISQTSRADYDDKALWDTFESSLNIKR